MPGHNKVNKAEDVSFFPSSHILLIILVKWRPGHGQTLWYIIV